MILKGKVHKFGEDVNTDYIISGRYKFKSLNMKELSTHIFEDIRPGFFKEISQGDFIVAGENFGCGSSREQAPLVIKESGISAVLSKSFARIFFRNCINVGLLAIECSTEKIELSDVLEINLEEGIIKNLTRKKILKFKKLPGIMIQILKAGGLAPYLKKKKKFDV
ncbi:MAG: 3-isopropylmalate dehydratase [bacterium (Candidatus Ratteibacteria) CG_4_10_14_3_um_filter_41_18]|uniref:3-isopropylmalate dehydratase small subunit n=4 Tax=Candidatus Ratteibacteria TaxID=2979319 RepID=A0A2M7YEU9_9BACT|nr:MAG: 3-isopropylmalate dehydratase [bacterium (Candidatus Ratteibacteria) CG01_land_8_20_14_3_00_40_19]PIW33940.1 MAG: 3-isopropylmalate dehydratase [bacterium (Candidatus Ratteibacteria) CG15_BIG_FIL_POST_REV_8_21_14_020_41_12]PIW74382.1 MAG: 3-isopropylmalate dehydratase [bacterium (Candidatus Ratteibacteria) CG_4_8_14_3_um_filter_41_36]PIX77719.1 MAG: 3-isopropylmalate dehydratase [bacterium (Candidatus Ratteibacteria) CG_4_10_14_3_um_filter_41_18]PJA61511.1 MAG: 3-isopropylmalate dehydra